MTDHPTIRRLAREGNQIARKAVATIDAAKEDHLGKAAEHYATGEKHEKGGDFEKAAGAYKNAAQTLGRFVNDCGYAEGYSLPQIQAIHASMNRREGK